MINYFAYGSNISEHRMTIERNIKFLSRKFAILEDYKLVFNKVSKNNCYLGFANIVKSKNSIIEGALYEMTESDLKIIDRFEGFPNHYYKETVEVACDGKVVQAVVYIANNNMVRENIKPDKKYLGYILEGKDIFTEDYYNNLLITKTLD